MGFKPQATVYNLTFIDGKYEGLVVKMMGMSIGRLVAFTNMEWNSKNPAENIRVFDDVASRVVEWNLEHPVIDNPSSDDPSICGTCGLSEDDPMPKIGKAFLCLDIVLIMKIMTTWQEAVASVAAPLEPPTPLGEKIETRLANLDTQSL